MEDDTFSIFKTIEKTDDREVIVNTLTGETYTIYREDTERILAEIEARGRDLEYTLTLIEKYYGKKKRYSRRKKR